MNDKEQIRFWAWVMKTDGCWTWKGCKRNGYGAFTLNNHMAVAHRLSFELNYGKIPPGMFVCHTCDNRACVRPSHLFLGDAKLNKIDSCLKGRHAFGEKNGKSKLTSEQVKFIRASTLSSRKLAAQFKVSQSNILWIRNGATWMHLLANTE